MKRIATIQDISCFGKCSLTVALPIISACGLEACPIPTAVLSTHTGGFVGYTFHDLTDDIEPIKNHWETLNLKFDGIYTGYLGSKRQLKIVSDFIDSFKDENSVVFVDPVMGDNGKLYSGFDADFANEMKTLVKKADVIVPNLTEAAYLLDDEYTSDLTDEEIKSKLIRLTDLGARVAIITGIRRENKLGVVSYDSESGEFSEYYREIINDSFHGTGDVFASVCVSSLVKGNTVPEAVMAATDFVVECIHATVPDKENHPYSVKFEECMPSLIKRMF